MNARADSVLIIRTGSANIASVVAAFNRLGVDALVTSDPAAVRVAARVVLPGVGAFGPAMARLRETGLDDALRERVERDRPLLAICLGLQVLFESSAESPGVSGLGITKGHAERFAPPHRTPQMGWNLVRPDSSEWIESAWMYFANSYCVRSRPQGWECATTDYAGDFTSAMRRGRTLACQFHPELSGKAGLSMMRRWLAREAARC